MDFFEYQEKARKSSRWLVILLVLAVIEIIVLIDLFFIYFNYIFSFNDHVSFEEALISVSIRGHITIAVIICSIILIASLFRIFELRRGGPQVVDELGGRLILPSTTDLKQRQLLNVVEEIAIASGMPVPQVYILNDNSINAFAAGYTIHDAVIGVTQGTVDLLTRDELQGVIAHEFSHILNGDMRLNMRLVGLLFGILFISIIGRKSIRYSFEIDIRFTIFALFFGAGLMIIGYGGLLIGNIIKASVSRQREYLADASAVQFTRNTEGIASALKKIGGWVFGSELKSSNATEFSHLYFSEGKGSSVFNTHPKLEERILRIDPRWNGKYIHIKPNEQKGNLKRDYNTRESSNFSSLGEKNFAFTTQAIASAVLATGTPTLRHIEYAKELIDGVPEQLLRASREPMTAYSLVLGLLINKDVLNNQSQLEQLISNFKPEIRKDLRIFLQALMSLNIKYRLPLIELAIPSLKSFSNNQVDKFKQDMKLIIKFDNRVEFWEWALYRIVELSLNKPVPFKARYDDFSLLEKECRILLSAVVYCSSCDIKICESAFEKAANKLGINAKICNKNEINTSELINAIKKASELKPLMKPRLLKSLSLAAEHDGIVKPEEVEFIRAISEGIDCPMPPLLDSVNNLNGSK